ncbi:ADP-ribose glycohydrolase ARH3-like [Gigantopelta aegis]|uniref:ADP-ribose glycohydrolase ARH3-like n=1 Tax=Gigantopelta aegis TaxID=1735272 RepID=UPI001B88A91E|nr:ADP-ribose glycohydrolase ARH3-like [Gigantopelta aegis]
MSLSRFQGSLVGAVVGDCIGGVFESIWGPVALRPILRQVEDLEQNYKHMKDGKKKHVLWYTDDTAMARRVAASLISRTDLDLKDLAKQFSDEYYAEPDRGYGGNVVKVFSALANPNLTDVLQPAREQFDGSGSYGNGGCMRIAPAALFAFSDKFEKLQDISEKITEITHSHPQAIQGAVLQSSAVDLALRLDNTHDVDTDIFIDTLAQRIKPLEENHKPETKSTSPTAKKQKKLDTYCSKLQQIRSFLPRSDVTPSEVEETLGNDISALGSAPTAVYAFLKALKPIKGIEDRSGFERTIIYAIHMGGDTDTIATMAGAIAGAFYGLEAIPASWQVSCEGVDDAKKHAEQLLALQTQTTSL